MATQYLKVTVVWYKLSKNDNAHTGLAIIDDTGNTVSLIDDHGNYIPRGVDIWSYDFEWQKGVMIVPTVREEKV